MQSVLTTLFTEDVFNTFIGAQCCEHLLQTKKEFEPLTLRWLNFYYYYYLIQK